MTKIMTKTVQPMFQGIYEIQKGEGLTQQQFIEITRIEDPIKADIAAREQEEGISKEPQPQAIIRTPSGVFSLTGDDFTQVNDEFVQLQNNKNKKKKITPQQLSSEHPQTISPKQKKTLDQAFTNHLKNTQQAIKNLPSISILAIPVKDFIRAFTKPTTAQTTTTGPIKTPTHPGTDAIN